MSAKRTSWNEFSSAMTSAIICLSTSRKFNFSKYIFYSLVRNRDNSSKFYMYPRFIQLIIQNQIGDLSTHTTKYISLALTQKVFANIRRIWKGFLRLEMPLFEGMLVVREDVEANIREEQILDDTAITAAQEVVTTTVLEDGADLLISLLQTTLDACAALTLRVEHLEHAKEAQTLEIIQLKKWVKELERVNKERMIVELDRDEGVELIGEKEKTKEVTNIVNNAQVEGRQAEKQAEIYQIDLDHPSKVLSMQEDDSEVQEEVNVQIILAVEPNILAVTITAAPVKVAATSTRRRRRVVIRDPEEELSAKTSDETKSKDKGKEAQARRNMIMNFKNIAGFKLDYFKGKSYDDIRPIFEAKFNTYMEFLLMLKEQIKEEESRALESINETPAQKAAKRRRLNQEDKDVEEIK
nr:hypothetical protein [Tanacetum cinerariifolium]